MNVNDSIFRNSNLKLIRETPLTLCEHKESDFWRRSSGSGPNDFLAIDEESSFEILLFPEFP